MTVRTLLGTVVLTLASALLSLTAAEIAARLWFRDITTTPDNTSYFALKWRAGNVRTNRLGFRERDFSEEKPPGVYRIAVVGDSFAWGQGIPEESRFSNLLERRLQSASPTARFEVLNFGKPGAETVDHVDILEKYVLPAAPDFVLLQWFVNDVEGRDKSRRPRYSNLVPINRLHRFLHAHFAFYYLLNSQWVGMQMHGGLSPEASYTDYLVDRFADPNAADALEARAELEKFVAEVDRAGLPMGIVMFPQLVDGLGEDYPLNFLLDRVLETCATEKLSCVDLRRYYRGVPKASDLWANRLDSHPGIKAHEIAARAIWDAYSPLWLVGAQ